MKTHLFARICTVALVAGCTAVPTVRYSRVDKPTNVLNDQFDAYSLQESVLKLDVSRDAKTGQLDMNTFAVTAVPAEYPAFKLALTHSNVWGVKTTLNITKRENTDLVKEIGSEVTDQRVELIGKIGSIITKAVPFTTTNIITPEDLPLVIPALVYMEVNKLGREAAEAVPIRNGVAIDFGVLPTDARPIEQMPLNERTSLFLYAACRSATVKVRLPGDVKYQKTVKVADPRYFQSVRFPLKGKVIAHSECGVSVASEAATGIKSGADIADAVVTQAIAIHKALEAKDGGK
jgi:hypothetical protein